MWIKVIKVARVDLFPRPKQCEPGPFDYPLITFDYGPFDYSFDYSGMGLARAKSRGQRRLQALLLIVHLAGMAKRLIGEAAEAAQLQLQLMSNNIKNRKTISVMTLATRVIERPDLLKKIADPWPYIHVLRQQAAAATGGAGVRV